jgi:hypothetical protein
MKLPEDVLQRLQSTSTSKKIWREGYIEELSLKYSPTKLMNMELQKKLNNRIIIKSGPEEDKSKINEKRKALYLLFKINQGNLSKKYIPNKEKNNDYGFSRDQERIKLKNYRFKLSTKEQFEETSTYAQRMIEHSLDSNQTLSLWKRNINSYLESSLESNSKLSLLASKTARSHSKETAEGQNLSKVLKLPVTETKKLKLISYPLTSREQSPELHNNLLDSFRARMSPSRGTLLTVPRTPRIRSIKANGNDEVLSSLTIYSHSKPSNMAALRLSRETSQNNTKN